MELQIITPPIADPADILDGGLVELTKAIDMIDPDVVAHGALGGSYGYGAQYENDVFVMRPFYWGDCDCGYDDRESEWSDTHKHSDECYQSEMKRRLIARGGIKGAWGVDRPDACSYDQWRAIEREIMNDLCAMHGLDPHFGSAVHCTCDHRKIWVKWSSENGHREQCSLQLPNFRHKATGLEVRWYKRIGRGMEVDHPEGADIAAILRECMASLPRINSARIKLNQQESDVNEIGAIAGTEGG